MALGRHTDPLTTFFPERWARWDAAPNGAKLTPVAPAGKLEPGGASLGVNSSARGSVGAPFALVVASVAAPKGSAGAAGTSRSRSGLRRTILVVRPGPRVPSVIV